MKTKIIISFILLAFILIASMGLSSVPQKVKVAFEKKYSKVKTVDWTLDESGNHVASFISNDMNKEATFMPNGSWLYTTSEIDLDDLPNCIFDYLDEEYVDSEALSSIIYEDPSVNKNYQVVITSGSIIDYEDEEQENWENEPDTRYIKLTFDECNFLSEEEIGDTW